MFFLIFVSPYMYGYSLNNKELYVIVIIKRKCLRNIVMCILSFTICILKLSFRQTFQKELFVFAFYSYMANVY